MVTGGNSMMGTGGTIAANVAAEIEVIGAGTVIAVTVPGGGGIAGGNEIVNGVAGFGGERDGGGLPPTGAKRPVRTGGVVEKKPPRSIGSRVKV